MTPSDNPAPPRRRPPTPAQVRRRRTVVGGLAAGAAILGIVVGAGAGTEPDDDSGSETTASACPERIAADPARLAGQRLVVRMEDAPTAGLLERARRGELGGVVLFPSEGVDPRVIDKGVGELRDAALVGGFEAPLVAIDQEGGDVERLPDLPPSIAPARIESEGGAETAREQGRRTGEALRELGIDVDLAPVLDIGGEGTFVAARAFSDDPGVVADLGTAFAAGLGEGGVAATAKHFPGLGTASADTDAGESVVETTREDLEPGLEPFEAAIAAGVPLVMTANATYAALDDRAPATLSRATTTKLLRDELGFEGVVITDDLGAGSIVAAGIGEGEAALAAAEAGADLLLFALSDGSEAAKALERGLRRGDLARAPFVASCERLAALRGELAG